jgi:uncharacterized membrane protein
MGDIMKTLPKSRLDAFADGVFAIVITLLVLDLPIPESSKDITALMPLWPDFLAYLISFAFIGSFWLAHSSITQLTKQETTRSYRFTLLMLFFVSLLPFTTKFMAAHINGPYPAFPVIIYGLDLLAASVMMNTIIRSLANTPDILVDEFAEGELNALRRRRQIAAVITGGAMILALFSPKIAVAGYVAAQLYYSFSPHLPGDKEA